LAGIGGQVEVLLEECAHLTLLVTSRHRLGLGAEWVMAVTGLSYPDGALDVEEATLFDAPALFLRRARQVRGAAVASDELPHVLRLCRLLDGAPLGLELAAGWTHLLSCRELVGEVERTFDVLAREGTSSDDRHGSLRGVFAHSWSLLSAGEGRALARLAVFRGGFTREAALAVAGCDLATLASLARKSLVQRVEEGRFRLLEVT